MRDPLSLSASCVAPLYIGPANAELLVGQPWRWVRDTARRLGVPILRVGGKPMIRAVELVSALDCEGTREHVASDAELAERARVELARRIGVGSGS